MLAVAIVVKETSKPKFFCFVQVKQRKPDLAKLETTDMGKPIQEAEWDMVRTISYWFCNVHSCIRCADAKLSRPCFVTLVLCQSS